MVKFRPTPLDLALAADPVAEADSRAIAAAATPPSWTVTDAATLTYSAALEEGRRRLALESERPASTGKGSVASAA